MITKRSTSIGYGNKYDILKNVKNYPAPNQYEKPSIFQVAKKKNKGKTFGVSREVKLTIFPFDFSRE